MAVDIAAVHVDRWRRLAVAATKECRCSTVPPVDMALMWAHLTAAVGTAGAGGEAVQMADVQGVELGTLLVGGCVRDRGGMLLVGPEGGFTPPEVRDFVRVRGMLVRLGGGRLRLKRAAVVAAAAIKMARAPLQLSKYQTEKTRER